MKVEEWTEIPAPGDAFANHGRVMICFAYAVPAWKTVDCPWLPKVTAAKANSPHRCLISDQTDNFLFFEFATAADSQHQPPDYQQQHYAYHYIVCKLLLENFSRRY